MATGSLSSLGIGSSAGLTSDTIDSLRKADESIMLTPIDNKVTANKSKKSDLSTLVTYLAGAKAQASSLSDDTSYLKRSTSVTGTSVSASADTAVAVQDIAISVSQLAKQSTFESSTFSSLDSYVFASNSTEDRVFSFYVGDSKKTVNLGKTSVTYSDLIEKINDQYGTSVTASSLKLADGQYKLILKSDATGADNQISFGTSSISNSRELTGNIDLTSGLTTTGDLKLAGATILATGTYASGSAVVTEINTQLTSAGLDSSYEASLDSNGYLVIESLDGSAVDFSSSDASAITELGLSSLELYADEGFTVTAGELQINGTDIVSGSNKTFSTIDDLITEINENTQITGVFASLDSSGNLKLKNADGEAISLTGDDWAKLGFTTTSSSAVTDGGVSGTTTDVSASVLSKVGFESLQNAQDAKFTYNGIEITRDTNTVNDLVVGLSLELETTGDSTVKIKRDNSSITDMINEFVSAYNMMLNKWSDLTDYNEETKEAGSLQGVSEVVRVKSNLNRILLSYDSTSTIKTLSDIGISMNETGLLTFDSSKLSEKMSSDPDGVEKFFRGYTGSINGKPVEIEGIFAKLNSELEKTIGGNGSLTLYSSNLTSDNDKLTEEREKTVKRLDARYETMHAQFAAYDALIAQMNNSFSALQMQIDAMVASKS